MLTDPILLLQILWTGTVTASSYVLLTIGFSLTQKVTGLWNFAQAGFMGIACDGFGRAGRCFAGVTIVFATEHVILRLSVRTQKHRLERYFAASSGAVSSEYQPFMTARRRFPVPMATSPATARIPCNSANRRFQQELDPAGVDILYIVRYIVRCD